MAVEIEFPVLANLRHDISGRTIAIARNRVNPWSGFWRTSRLLIHDRLALFSEQFRQVWYYMASELKRYACRRVRRT